MINEAPQNKAMDSTQAPVKTKEQFFYPHLGKTIEAENQAEADKIAGVADAQKSEETKPEEIKE